MEKIIVLLSLVLASMNNVFAATVEARHLLDNDLIVIGLDPTYGTLVMKQGESDADTLSITDFKTEYRLYDTQQPVKKVFSPKRYNPERDYWGIYVDACYRGSISKVKNILKQLIVNAEDDATYAILESFNVDENAKITLIYQIGDTYGQGGHLEALSFVQCE